MNITGGKYNSRKINAPKSDLVRPTLSKIRSGVFNVLASMIDFEGLSFLDVFSGSGIMSLEAISRGFSDVIMIEKNPKIAQIIKQNFSALDLTPDLIIKDANKALDTLQNKFDVIYIDPPYKNFLLYSSVLQKIIDKNLSKDGGIIVIEHQKEIEGFIIPKEMRIFKEKIYGDTTIKFLQIIR